MIDTSHDVEPFGNPIGVACFGFGSLDIVALESYSVTWSTLMVRQRSMLPLEHFSMPLHPFARNPSPPLFC